jgi:hypothetical protein
MPADEVFLSYHPRDVAVMSRIDSDLGKRGIATFLSPRDVKPGESKDGTVKERAAASKHMVAGISPSYLNDPGCRTQLFLARANGVQVLPILAGEFPEGDSPLHWLLEAGREHTYAVKGLEELDIADFSGRYPRWGAGSYESNFERLVDAINPIERPQPLTRELSYVSYHTSDVLFAGRLVRDLEAARACVWFDKLNIRVGANWRSAMYEGMQRARRLVVCLSPRAAASEHVNHEVLLALQRSVAVLPVVSDAWATGEGKEELENALAKSREMRSLIDRAWLTAEHGYEAMFGQLKKTLQLGRTASKRTGIFLSYRRADSQAITGRIREHLVKHFGPNNVFLDVGTIAPGTDFSAEYRDWIQTRAAVMLVVIGKSWPTVSKTGAGDTLPRIQTDGDHVRTEVATGLSTPGVRVVPVLVDHASMPRQSDLPADLHPLTGIQGQPVRHDPDFAHDIDSLVAAVRLLIER